ncbi:hypothetical protein AB0E10_15500 [Streptomyces sp. NPDC048045]|uniref:hypothetical protein n=1 Tax=Streptomyces sp. NPDC048045 TaxID=3154710 RepID=UPI00342B4D31
MLVESAVPEAGLSAIGDWVSSPTAGPPAEVTCGVLSGLPARLGEVGDGRRDQGRLYPVAAVPAPAAGAVVAGIRSPSVPAGAAPR